MENYKKITAFALCTVIIALALAYASFHIPLAANQQTSAYSGNLLPKYSYAGLSYAAPSAIASSLTLPNICDECGTEVTCQTGQKCQRIGICSNGQPANSCVGISQSTCGGLNYGTCPIGYVCEANTCTISRNIVCKPSYSCVKSPNTSTSTSTTSTSTTTTSTSTTSTAFYSCDECFPVTKGDSCPSSCKFQSSGPTNGCPSGYIACSPSSTPPKIKCGFLPPSLATSLGSDEPWYCPINQSLYLSWQKDIPVALIVVMIAFLIAGGIFMVGAGIKNNRIRNFGIGELYEAVASAIIVAFFVYLSAVIFGLIPGVFVGAINPYATSLHLITTTINSAENVYTGLFHAYDYDMYLSTLSVDLSVPSVPQLNITGTVVKYALLPLDIYFIEPTAVVSGFIYDGILALYAEYYLIVFFAIASIPVFLIPGVILRVLLPTRSLGGILIALAAGFYFVMPLLFAVAFYFTAPHITTQMNNIATLLNGYSIGKGAVNNAVTPSSPLVLTLSALNSSMNGFWLLILFYPALISAVTYAFVVQLANFIGGAARMSGRARAKFI